jgi:hypothetical protein
MSFIAALMMFLQSMFGTGLDSMTDVHITTSQYDQVVSQSTSGVTGATSYSIERSSDNLIVVVDANEL